MKFRDQVLSEEDFEQLPPALRRKVSRSPIRYAIAPSRHKIPTLYELNR